MLSFRGAPSTSLGTGSGDEESLYVLDFVSREIPRFARNDRLKPFFSNLLEAKKQGMSIPAPGFAPQTQDRPICPGGEARRLAAPAPSRERFRQAKPGQKLREDSLRRTVPRR